MKSRPGIFARFFISYLLVLSIPIAIGAFAYQKTVRLLEEEGRQTSLMVLEHAKSSLDGQLETVFNLLNRLSVNPQIIHFMDKKLPLSDDDYYRLNVLVGDLHYYLLNNSQVLDFNIYYKKADMTVTSETTFHGVSDYETFYKYGDYTYEQYAEMLTTGERRFMPPQSAKVMKMPRDTIAYVSPLAASVLAEPYGAIVIYLEAAHIRKLLDSLSNHFQGEAYIFDGRGQIMASTHENALFSYDLVNNESAHKGHIQTSSDGKDILVSYVKSNDSNWSFVAVTPKEVLLAKAYYIQKLTVTIAVIIVVLGAFAACILSYRQSRPIRELMQTIRQHYEEVGLHNIFAAMKNAFLELNSSKERLEGIVEKQTPLFYRVFLERLASGSFKSEGEIMTFADHAKVNLDAKRYIWLLIELHDYEEEISERLLKKLNFDNFLLKNLMNDLLGERCVSMDLSERKVVYLYSSSDEYDRVIEVELEDKMEQFIHLAVNKFQLTITIAIGRPHSDLMDSWKYFQETRTTLEHAPVNRYCKASQLDFTSDIFYPVELEIQLINACKSGDSDNLDRLLTVLYAENIEQRVLSSNYRVLLLQELRATLIKLDPQTGIEHEGDERTQFEAIKNSFHRLCSLNEHRKKTQYSELSEQMLDYVQRNYSDPNLSLSSLSNRYSISESYISLLFKEHAGENFSTILENVRISKACQYLLESHKSIQDISLMVGYNSDKTFRRAFKRVKGVQPTAYRELESQ